MKHVVTLHLHCMIYIPNFMAIGSTVTSSTISEVAMLVLLKGRIY
jgi:hypothetical protein